MHEVHRVRGADEDDFAAAYRDPEGWMQTLGLDDDARLLYYCHHAHGTGPSYRIITITAIADGAAWERLARRLQGGDLAAWARRVDALRYDVTAKLLLPAEWSPMNELDLRAIPTTSAEHAPTLFMEDTGWPDVSVDDYVEFWGTEYKPMLDSQPEATRLLEIQAGWVPALGAGRRPEAILWQRVHNIDRLIELLATELPPDRKAPGTFMAKGLSYRDQWESRLLRTAAWSPLC
jgi:uncharacterized protein (DUF736 family)